MTTESRFERHLPDMLEDLYLRPSPDYRDDVLAVAVRSRQRPAWSFPGRWIPMVDIARPPLVASRLPVRSMGLALVLVALLLAAVAAFIVGTRRDLPAPFGPARNGLVAFSRDGDIYTADSTSGTSRAIVAGGDLDVRPIWSLDGTRLAFERKTKTLAGQGALYVAEPDGTGLIKATPTPLSGISSHAFSADGTEILVSTKLGRDSKIHVVKVDGTGIRTVETGTVIPSEAVYRPPLGNEIAFVGAAPGAEITGLYAVKPDGTGLRTIVPPSTLIMSNPRWSSDGTRITYTAYAADYETGGSLLRAWLASADGTSNRVLRQIPADDLNSADAVSNDGSRVVVGGCHPVESNGCEVTSAIETLDGTKAPIRIDVPARYAEAEAVRYQWAPDDSSIVLTPVDEDGRAISASVLVDPMTGASRPAPWTGAVDPSWQRLAR